MMRILGFAAATAGLLPLPAMAQDDAAARGEAAFRMCSACHTIGAGASHRLGPELNGVMGAPAASRPGFSYSLSLTERGAGGLVWDDATLAQFLRKPAAFVPGTKMAFAGISDTGRISDIAAYLATFSPAYVPPTRAAPVDKQIKN